MSKSYSHVLQSDLFDQAPFSIWIEDWSIVKPVLEDLCSQQIEDLSAYFWNNPELVKELANSTRILEFNSATPKMYRAPNSEQFWDFANNDFQTEDEFEAYLDTLTSFAKGQTRVVVQGWEKTWNGEQIYVRDTVFIPNDHQNDWARVLHITEDITERYMSEEILRQSETRYREIFEESPAAIWEEDWSDTRQMIDQLAETGVSDWQIYFTEHPQQLEKAYYKSKVIDVSQAVIDTYRVPSKNFLEEDSRYWLVTDGELGAYRDTLCAFMMGESRYEFTTTDTRYDGTKGMFREVASLPPAYRKNWSRVLYFIEDVTERVEMENTLRERESRYREIFEASPAAIWEEDWSEIKKTLDKLVAGGVEDWKAYFAQNPSQLSDIYDQASVVDISQAALDAYRAPSKDYLDINTKSSSMTKDELIGFVETIMAFLEGKLSHEVQGLDTRYDNSEGIYRKVASLPPAYREDWSRVLYSIEDITEQKETELQLQQALKMEAVGKLTGGVAHDFNNILAVIKGYAELLDGKTDDDSELKQYISQIDIATDRATELTHRLLAFSRQQPLRPAVVQLPELIEGMTDMLTWTLSEVIEIETSFEDPVWDVVADPGQLENVLLNLAINSKHAMPDGGTLRVQADNLSLDRQSAEALNLESGDYVRLLVTDTGCGIEPKNIDHVFEPFFTTKGVGAGSGLGLSMIYGFAQQSGGNVTIKSKISQGTTVSLYLPRAADGKFANRPEIQANLEQGITCNETLLIVEDDSDVLNVIVEMLRSLDYDVEVASNGESALSIIKQHNNVDLLITDVVLGGNMSGPELVEEMRARSHSTPVLLVSGYAPHEIKIGDLLGRGAHFLKKPFSKFELSQSVRTALDDKVNFGR